MSNLLANVLLLLAGSLMVGGLGCLVFARRLSMWSGTYADDEDHVPPETLKRAIREDKT